MRSTAVGDSLGGYREGGVLSSVLLLVLIMTLSMSIGVGWKHIMVLFEFRSWDVGKIGFEVEAWVEGGDRQIILRLGDERSCKRV